MRQFGTVAEGAAHVGAAAHVDAPLGDVPPAEGPTADATVDVPPAAAVDATGAEDARDN